MAPFCIELGFQHLAACTIMLHPHENGGDIGVSFLPIRTDGSAPKGMAQGHYLNLLKRLILAALQDNESAFMIGADMAAVPFGNGTGTVLLRRFSDRFAATYRPKTWHRPPKRFSFRQWCAPLLRETPGQSPVLLYSDLRVGSELQAYWERHLRQRRPVQQVFLEAILRSGTRAFRVSRNYDSWLIVEEEGRGWLVKSEGPGRLRIAAVSETRFDVHAFRNEQIALSNHYLLRYERRVGGAGGTALPANLKITLETLRNLKMKRPLFSVQIGKTGYMSVDGVTVVFDLRNGITGVTTYKTDEVALHEWIERLLKSWGRWSQTRAAEA